MTTASHTQRLTIRNGPEAVDLSGTEPAIASEFARTTHVVCIGDSITANAGADPRWGPRGYAAWVYLLGNGRYRRVAHCGTASYTTAQILASMVPLAIARTPKPAYAVVVAGTNDVNLALATTTANLTAIYQQLRAASITPVCCTIPPRTDALAAVHKINGWIYRYAQANGLPFADTHAALVDPTTGGYLSGYAAGDGIHPSSTGAKAMGQAIVTVLDAITRPMSPPLVTTDADPGNLQKFPLFQAGFTDANSDNLPDGSGSQRGLVINSGTGNFATSYAADAGNVVGRWWETTLSDAAGCSFITGSSGTHSVAAGDRIGWGFRVKLTGSDASTQIAVWLSQGNSSSTYPTGDAFPIYGSASDLWTNDFGPVSVYGEVVVPSGMTTLRVNASMSGTVGAKLSIGQLTLKNLTSLGVI